MMHSDLDLEQFWHAIIHIYYMEESVLLGTKPRHDSRLLLLLNWFLTSRLFSLHIIKRTLHGGSKIWIYVLVARAISHSFAALTREILFLPLEH